jgi:histidinol-phosphate phosphatase family protein
MNTNKAIFLDKDGTVIKDVPYNVDPELIKLNDGVGETLSALKDAGYKLIVISNQPGISLGLFTCEALEKVSSTINELLKPYHVVIDGFFYCPHLPSDYCDCRKPAAALIFKAAREMKIDLSSSWMVGDILNDIEAGKRSGCKTILLDNGGETEWVLNTLRTPDHLIKQFDEIHSIVLSKKQHAELPGAI